MLFLLTRPQGRNAALARLLSLQGLASLELPALALEPALGEGNLPLPRAFDLVVFVSRYAGQCYLDALARQHGGPWPEDVWAATVGVGSAQALLARGEIAPDRMLHPQADSTQDSEALWARIAQRGLHPERVLIVRGDTGRDWLGDRLQQEGASVQRLAAYRRTPAAWTHVQAQQLSHALAGHSRHAWLLTSREGVLSVAGNLRRLGLRQAWRDSVIITVHPRIADCVQNLLRETEGVEPSVIVSRPDEPGLFATMMALAKP